MNPGKHAGDDGICLRQGGLEGVGNHAQELPEPLLQPPLPPPQPPPPQPLCGAFGLRNTKLGVGVSTKSSVAPSSNSR